MLRRRFKIRTHDIFVLRKIDSIIPGQLTIQILDIGRVNSLAQYFRF